MAEQQKKLSEFIEKHLVLMMLTKPSDLPSKIAILASTKMPDALSDAYLELHGSAPLPSAFPILASKDKILAELEELDQKAKPLFKSKEDLLESEIQTLKVYAKLQYEIGDYSGCANALEELRRVDQRDVWGELMADILLDKKQAAMNLIDDVQDEMHDLRDKAWLLHIALFAAFPESPAFFYELTACTKFINTIEIGCPHLIRYVVAASLLSKPYGLVEIIKNYSHIMNNDPALQFCVELFTTFNFERVFQLIEIFKSEIQNDFFLEKCSSKIVYEAKKFVVFNYLKLNLKVDSQWIHENTKEESKKVVEEIQSEYQVRLHFDGKHFQKAQHRFSAHDKIQPFTEMITHAQKLLSKSVKSND